MAVVDSFTEIRRRARELAAGGSGRIWRPAASHIADES